MGRDYYFILGVPVDAAPDAIRSAFRRLARRYHPDRRQQADADTFRDVSEAYEVLSDPVRRARYNRELRRPGTSLGVPSAGRDVGEPEPLTNDPMPITGQPELVQPSYEALFERLVRNSVGAGTPKAEREQPLDFELIMSPDEAERGVHIPFQVPVLAVCFRCGGSGRDWLFTCEDCHGEGRIVDEETVTVEIPPDTRDGTLVEVSLDSVGVANLWLRVHVRVERHG